MIIIPNNAIAAMMDQYRKLGIKLTPQRLAILEYLEGNQDHPSAEDIFRAVSKKHPTMSFATVYNTLEALKQRGHLRELTVDPAKKRFDPNAEPHHHLVCIQCRKMVDIHQDFNLHISRSERRQFEIIGSHVEFFGLCGKCRKHG